MFLVAIFAIIISLAMAYGFEREDTSLYLCVCDHIAAKHFREIGYCMVDGCYCPSYKIKR